MRKIFYVLSLIATITLISGNKQSEKETTAKQVTKPVIPTVNYSSNKSVLSEVKSNGDSLSTGKVRRSLPGILLILTDDQEKSTGSPSPLWNYLIGKSRQSGC